MVVASRAAIETIALLNRSDMESEEYRRIQQDMANLWLKLFLRKDEIDRLPVVIKANYHAPRLAEEVERLRAVNAELAEAAKNLIDNWPAYWIIPSTWPKEYQARLDALRAALAHAQEVKP